MNFKIPKVSEKKVRKWTRFLFLIIIKARLPRSRICGSGVISAGAMYAAATNRPIIVQFRSLKNPSIGGSEHELNLSISVFWGSTFVKFQVGKGSWGDYWDDSRDYKHNCCTEVVQRVFY